MNINVTDENKNRDKNARAAKRANALRENLKKRKALAKSQKQIEKDGKNATPEG